MEILLAPRQLDQIAHCLSELVEDPILLAGDEVVAQAVEAVAQLSQILLHSLAKASRLLPLSLFGLLSYLEPVLLLGASLLLDEILTVADAFVYIPIVIALVLLGLSGGRRRREHLEEPPL